MHSLTGDRCGVCGCACADGDSDLHLVMTTVVTMVLLLRFCVAAVSHCCGAQLMIGYLIFASANLLGYTGGYVLYTALQVYDVILDWPTLIFVMYNFAVAGVVAVFWQKVRAPP